VTELSKDTRCQLETAPDAGCQKHFNLYRATARPGQQQGTSCAQVDADVLRRVGLWVRALARPVRGDQATRAVRLVLAPVQRQSRREVALARVALVPLPAIFRLLSMLGIQQATARTAQRKLLTGPQSDPGPTNGQYDLYERFVLSTAATRVTEPRRRGRVGK